MSYAETANYRQRRRPRVLLGVTGSVAAIKVPELVCRLAVFADVHVVLTKGGSNFWYANADTTSVGPAQTYNPEAWEQMQQLVRLSPVENTRPMVDGSSSGSSSSSSSTGTVQIEST